MADVQYYLSEDKNQILVSGSSTKDGMNALLTSSKLHLQNLILILLLKFQL